MTIEVPKVELEHLDNAPLALALAQVRFDTILAIEKSEVVSGFQDQPHMKSSYRLEGPLATHQLVLQLGPVPGQSRQLDQPNAQTLWRFHHKENDWVVSLSSTSLAIEASTYHDFDSFSAELRAVVACFCEVFDPSEQVRFGLRYVNHVPLKSRPKSSRFDRINPQLLGPIGSELGVDVDRSLAEIQFHQRDGAFVLRHGLVDVAPAPGMGAAPALKAQEQTYLLDFDYYTEIIEEFSAAKLATRMAKYHAKIESVFFWSLSKSYLSELGVKAVTK